MGTYLQLRHHLDSYSTDIRRTDAGVHPIVRPSTLSYRRVPHSPVVQLLRLGSQLVISIEPSYLRVRPLSSVGEYSRIIISIPH
jgi:hypothetical protein